MNFNEYARKRYLLRTIWMMKFLTWEECKKATNKIYDRLRLLQ